MLPAPPAFFADCSGQVFAGAGDLNSDIVFLYISILYSCFLAINILSLSSTPIGILRSFATIEGAAEPS
jgi:hypothetical protein